MADLSFIIEEIRDEWRKKAEKGIRDVAKNNIDEVKRVRNQIIEEWFERFNGSDFSDIRVQHVIESHGMNGFSSGFIKFESWTESAEIGTFESAEKWRSRPWRKDAGVASNLWVSDLVFDKGIIGLPLNSQIPGYSGWGWSNGVNLHYHQKEPLDFAIFSSSKWVDFMNKVEQELYAKIN